MVEVIVVHDETSILNAYLMLRHRGMRWVTCRPAGAARPVPGFFSLFVLQRLPGGHCQLSNI
jgi:hypothetical protein